MKRNYRTIKTFIVLLSLFTISLNAQLNGLYTINSGQPTGGTNFQTFTACAQVLNTLGVTGPVTINVVANSGPYVEQVQFMQAPGSSPVNSVVINGNGNTITFGSTNAGQPWTIDMNGADYMEFNNLNIMGTGATYAMVLHFWNQANNNSVNSCTMTAPIGSSSTIWIPLSFSGSGTSGTTLGNHGNNNTVNGCTLVGGYYGITMYGLSSSPFSNGNRILNTNVRDWYIYGLLHTYNANTQVRGCTFERPTHPNPTSGYGVYFNTGTYSITVDGNRFRNYFGGNPASTNLAIGVYAISAGLTTSVNVVSNNVVSDMYSNGALYGVYVGSAYTNAFHNTIVFNDPNSASTGIVYGMYVSNGTGVNVRNNIVDIRRAGTGTKYCMYVTTPGMTINNNNLYYQNIGGTCFTGYYAGLTFSTLANWQTANGNAFDQQSVAVDPLYNNPGLFDYSPNSPLLNALGTPQGITTDINGSARSLTTPDIGAYEFLNTPCTGIPSSNAITSPTFVMCPNSGTTTLGFITNYTVNGLTFQWNVSTTSPVGPFAAVPGATLVQAAIPNPSVTSYYNVVVTCMNGGGTYTASSTPILIAGPTTSVVPYFEDFESVALPNRMPNCSWAISDANVCRTYTGATTQNRYAYSGSKFAAFSINPAGVNYYYTNGIQMNAGVTYSAALWFMTESTGATNWSDLSILVGNAQSPAGLVSVASTSAVGAAVSPAYKLLNGTFTVPSSGLYYVAIRATGNPGTAQHLSWDDLSVTVPCNLNTPSVNIAASPTACVGKPFMITASGGANSYSWSTGATGPILTTTPNLGTSGYILTAMNLASGCVANINVPVSVYPSPLVNVFATQPGVCAGQSITLFASGANTYAWSNSAFGPLNNVSPMVTTSYTVVGTNAFGCTGTAVQQVNVNPAPTINVNGANSICAGETVTLTASGASTYKWLAPTSLILANPAIVSPASSVNYTVTGTDANGCESVILFGLNVNLCTGISKHSSDNGMNVYPNPANNDLTIELNNGFITSVEVTDISGKLVMMEKANAERLNLNFGTLANGVYYVKVKSDTKTEIVKVIKE